MKNRTMADMAVYLDDRFDTGETVHYGSVLQIASHLEDQAPEISTQTSARSDVTVRTNNDIADQYCRGVHKRRRIDDRNNSVNGINLWHPIKPWVA